MDAARPDESPEAQENLSGAKGLPERPALDREALSSAEFLSAHGISQLKVVDATGSTNADLLRAVTVEPKAWPDLAVLTAEHQTAARGRLDRALGGARAQLCPGLHRPAPRQRRRAAAAHPDLLLALAAGCPRAPRRAAGNGGLPAELKWPNDVLVAAGKSPASWPSSARWGTAPCRRSSLARG